MLERMYFCSKLVDTAIQAVEAGDSQSAKANLQALKNILDNVNAGDEGVNKVIKNIAAATGVDDLKTLENLILVGCNIAARGHGTSQATYAAHIEREASIAKLVTLPMLGIR
jgi:hypothetical protein